MEEKLIMEAEEKKLRETIKAIDEQIKTVTEGLLNLRNNTTDPYMYESIKKMYLERKKSLENAKEKPYFARIDFKDYKKNITDEIYIGKTNIEDENGNLLVLDWRAPISSLYYDGRIGTASYNSPDGIVNGELILKRIFDIENEKLFSFSDIDISVNDEILKPYLSSNSELRLKNIISTIQAEQNSIIRCPLKENLIVQGVAGSGKTTVALHRIAYLAYNYSKELKPEDFMIIAPNKFFLDYISNILPDLGVNDVNQCTFEQFAEQIIGNGIKIENSTNKLAETVNLENKETASDTEISKFKSSILYKQMLDRYLHNVEESYLPDENLKIGNIVLLKHDKLNKKFEDCLKGKPLEERLKMFKSRLKMFFENNQDLIEKMVRNQRSEEISNLDRNKLSNDEYEQKRAEIFQKYNEYLDLLKNNAKKLIDEYIKKVKKPNTLNYYIDFISNIDKYAGDCNINPEIFNILKQKILNTKSTKQVEYEDLAPLMYIAHKIRGTEKQIKDNINYPKHIVIDEAQDYSPFQFLVLKEILKNNSMTILGDISQGIYVDRGIKDWNEIKDEVFLGDATITDLTKSYRTTVEIMEKGNDVIHRIMDKSNIKLAEPVIRRGKSVAITKSDDKDLANNIIKKIRELTEDKNKNIAIITKTLQEATDLRKKLEKQNIKSTLISDKSTKYNGGVSVIPSYLSKGLEFDSVILSNVNSEKYKCNELDTKLLYIAITRAMHTLDIFYTKQQSELLYEREKNIEER